VDPSAHECRIRLTAPQTLARRTLLPRTTTALDWGRGCGKTTFTLLLWAMLVAEHDGKVRGPSGKRGVRIVHLMPTFKQFRDVYGELIEEMINHPRDGISSGIAGLFYWLGARLNRTTWHISFPGGSWIQPFGAKEANRSRGLRCDVCTVDEADDIEPGVIDGIVKPWFSEPWSLGILMVEGTPRRGRHGLLWREVIAGRQRKPGHYSYHATYRDVPEHVSQEYVAQVKADTAPAIFAREWECDFDSAEGLVYPMFDEAFHVRSAQPGPWEEVLVGADHGWSAPGAFLVIGVQGHGADAICHVFEEVYETEKEDGWWTERARDIKRKCSRWPMRWYGDPSMPGKWKTIGNAAQVRFLDTNNDRKEGVSAVTDRLVIRVRESGEGDQRQVHRRARLFVDPSCRNLIWEMRNYRRKPDPMNKDRYLDEIQDGNDHAQDALRYAIYSRFGKPAAGRVDYGAGWA